jgi:hypothetical protein
MIDIRDYIKYNPTEGSFTWIKWNGSPRCIIGKPAGYRNNLGYRIIKFNRQVYKGSHVAFFCMTGKWPQQFMDHINRDKTDDRWENLREATKSQNGANRAPWGISGIKGVKVSYKNTYEANLRHNGKDIYLGSYKTVEEASAAYERAAKAYHGEFAFVKRGDTDE